MASQNAPKDLAAEIGVEDLYGFLGISSTSTEKEITRGYRKKALKYHPDKNPDSPSAVDLFQKLSKAYSILTDPAAKAAYDKWLKAKFAAKQRHEELNAKRRKLKESLESKEKAYTTHGFVDEREAARNMQKEIERLREEGFRKMQEQEHLLRQQFEATPTNPDGTPTNDDMLPTLKVTWKANKSDPTNGGYSKDILKDIFTKYAPVHHILVSSKKNGKALVSFDHHTDFLSSVVGSESGLAENPLKVTWMNGEPSLVKPTCTKPVNKETMRTVQQPAETGARNGGPGYLHRDNDYESITLMRLRQAEERKRLCEQLLQEGPQ